VLDAKTPQAVVGVEGEDARVDNRYISYFAVISLTSLTCFVFRMLKDDRVKQIQNRSIFVQDDFSDRLG
jgi:hypothetical protein